MVHGQHDLAHVGHQAQIPGRRRVHALLVLHLHGRGAGLGSVRLIIGMGSKIRLVGKKLCGKGLQRLHVGAHIRKQVVCDVGLQGCGPGHGAFQNRHHGLLRDLFDGDLLPVVGILHHACQIVSLVDRYGSVDADERKNDDQHQVEDLLLQAADLDPSYDLHSMVRISVKPVTSKISMMVSFTCTSFMLP